MHSSIITIDREILSQNTVRCRYHLDLVLVHMVRRHQRTKCMRICAYIVKSIIDDASWAQKTLRKRRFGDHAYCYTIMKRGTPLYFLSEKKYG